MFSTIAPTYDRLNRIISFTLDQRWRRRAVGTLAWERHPDGVYLDLCAGTLDFSTMLAGQPGFRVVEGRRLEIRPCVPDEWPSYRVTYRLPGERTRYEVTVRRDAAGGSVVREARLDGEPLPVRPDRALVPVVHDGAAHVVEILLAN